MKKATQMLIDAIEDKRNEALEHPQRNDWDNGRNYGYDEACTDIIELIKGIIS